jgi:hypothetical protein
MEKLATIYKFETENFKLEMNALEEYDVNFDMFDEDCKRATIRSLESGELVVFCAKALLIDKQTGQELASDYLGQCIYESYEAFRDNLGVKNEKHGSYFSDMIHTVLKEGRKAYNEQKKQVELNH